MRRLVALFALGASLAVVAPLHGDGGTPTYADVAPIFDSKCAGCHYAGGIAPFSLRNAVSKSSKPMRMSPGRWIKFATERTLWLMVMSATPNA